MFIVERDFCHIFSVKCDPFYQNASPRYQVQDNLFKYRIEKISVSREGWWNSAVDETVDSTKEDDTVEEASAPSIAKRRTAANSLRLNIPKPREAMKPSTKAKTPSEISDTITNDMPSKLGPAYGPNTAIIHSTSMRSNHYGGGRMLISQNDCFHNNFQVRQIYASSNIFISINSS